MSTMHTEAYPRLVADIGGTNARFALETAPQVIEKAEILPCKDYDTIVDAVKTYLERAGSPKVLHAAFAIANPILGDKPLCPDQPCQCALFYRISGRRRASLVVKHGFLFSAKYLGFRKQAFRV